MPERVAAGDNRERRWFRPSTAARLLRVHINTVYRWCSATVAGEPSRFRFVITDATGHYLIARDEVLAIVAQVKDANSAVVDEMSKHPQTPQTPLCSE